jgi:hypothetical protein
MAFTKSTTTKHTCGGPTFGRKTPGCPRCDELLAGAAPVVQSWRGQRQRDEAERSAAIHAHFAPGGPHNRGDCGPVCTAFDW